MVRKDRAIVLVDREPRWLEFGKLTLSESGFRVYAVSTVQAAKELIATHSEADRAVILVDARSFEDEQPIIADLTHPELRSVRPLVVLFPTNLSPDRLRRAFKQGAADCVGKPYDETGLLALVEHMLAEGRLATARPDPRRMHSGKLLIVEDDRDWAATLVNHLPLASQVIIANGRAEAEQQINLHAFDLAVIDLRLVDADDSNFEGLDLVSLIRKKDRERSSFTQIIVISAYGTEEHIRTLYAKYNAHYYFDKRYMSPCKFRESVYAALAEERMEHQL